MLEVFNRFMDRYEYWIMVPLIIYIAFLCYELFKGGTWKSFKDEVLRKGE